MFRGCAFQRNDFVQQLVELRQFCRAELLLHPGVVRLDGLRKPPDQLHAPGRRLHDGAALVFGVAFAAHEAVALHAGEHAGEAGAEDEGLASDAARLHGAVLAQYAQHAPLLVRQAVAAQARPGVGHDGLARLQEEARQVAVLERGSSHDAAN